jgi:hypothetical protein
MPNNFYSVFANLFRSSCKIKINLYKITSQNVLVEHFQLILPTLCEPYVRDVLFIKSKIGFLYRVIIGLEQRPFYSARMAIYLSAQAAF